MTKRCPITYKQISDDALFHPSGLKLLAPKLQSLSPLPFTERDLRFEAAKFADKLSIQGVQYKLSGVLNIKNGKFEFVEKGGKYILKPPSDLYLQLPENEDVSMRLAKSVGIEVPVHGLIYNADQTFTYFIKRFDRAGHKDKLALEDFSQLTAHYRTTKYDSSMEKVADVIEKYCTFPEIEKIKLFERVIFNYLIGNEDMHLKNFSLITRNNKIELSPAYDFINSTIVLKKPKEELALPLNGKKNNITHNDLVKYYGQERLKLSDRMINNTMKKFEENIELWQETIETCFLSDEFKKKYIDIIKSRANILGINNND